MGDRDRVLRIIYLAIVSSVFAYAGVLEVVAPKAAQPFQEQLLWVLLATAIGSTAAAFGLPKILLRQARQRGIDEAQQRYSLSILRWGLSESIAVLGLVLGFLNGPRPWVLGFFLWALILLALFHPWRPSARGGSGD